MQTTILAAPTRCGPLARNGLVAIFVGIGLGRLGLPPLIPVLVAAGWIGSSAAGYLGAMNLGGYVLGAAVADPLSRSYGTTRPVRGALILATVSFLASAAPFGLPWLLGWRLVAGLAGGLLMVIAAPAVISATPATKYGLVSAVVFSGLGLGIVLSGVLVPVFAPGDVGTTWLVLGTICLVMSAGAWSGWPEPHAGFRPVVGGIDLGGFWPLLAAYACSAVGFVPHLVYLADFVARGLALGVGAGGAVWVLLGVGAGVGPLLVGRVAHRLPASRAFRGALLLEALGVLLPALCPSIAAAVVSTVVVGALMPGIVQLALGATVERVPAVERGRAWGWMTLSFALALSLAGYGMAALFSAAGAYTPLFVGGSAIVAVGLVVYVAGDKTPPGGGIS
jgi:predicted MFS family arabinose efflux permease